MSAIDRYEAMRERRDALKSVLECVDVDKLNKTGVTADQVQARRLYRSIDDAVTELIDALDELSYELPKAKRAANKEHKAIQDEERRQAERDTR